MRCVLVLFFLLAPAFAQQIPSGLQKLLDDQTAAWNRGDLEGFMRGYWKSDELTFFSGDTIIHGWQPTLDRYRKRYQSGGQAMGKLSFSDEKIDLLGPEAAVVTARWHLAMPDGKKLEGLTTVVCKQFPDGWKIVHDHSS